MEEAALCWSIRASRWGCSCGALPVELWEEGSPVSGWPTAQLENGCLYWSQAEGEGEKRAGCAGRDRWVAGELAGVWVGYDGFLGTWQDFSSCFQGTEELSKHRWAEVLSVGRKLSLLWGRPQGHKPWRAMDSV